MIQKCKFRNDPPICVISFLELTFLDHFFCTKYGALYLHYVLLLLPVGSFFLMTNWWIMCMHGWSGKSWIILLGNGGRRVVG